MPKHNKKSSHINRMATFARRHRVLLSVLAILTLTYVIIRLFFTPPLLSGTTFSYAFYDRNGTLMRLSLTPDEKYRTYTPLDKISPHLIRATILYEDKYFYYHPGVNPISLIGATINHFSGHSRPIGASTITMQVARMKYDMQTTTIPGKLKQIAVAIYIDLFYSKDEILTAYLNMAPYGGNIESIGAASLIYFHQSAEHLSQIQAITLATIPQNPVKRGLNTTRGLTNIMNMRRDLITRWIQHTPSDTVLATMADMPLHVFGTSDLPFHAPHFTDRAITHHRRTHRIDDSAVQTTLDLKLQQKMEQRLRTEINRRKSIGVKNAAAILLNYKTMQVLSYIGSADYFDKNIYGENDGVRARRSPGSTLKPLIYAAAIDAGHIHGMTLLKDAKINFGVYAPENADSEFYGPILARDALTHSRNIPAINLVRKIGVRNFYKLLSDSGVSDMRTPEYYGISVALGGAEVSMFELAKIYATMANLGRVSDIKTELSHPRDNHTTQILSPEAFFITLDMLSRQSTPQANIPFARQKTSPLRHYWKTGTSSSFRDAWTAGIFGDYVLIVWVGNFDGRPNNAFSGAKTAAPIYFALADTVIKYNTDNHTPPRNNNFLRDDMNISQIDMCSNVGGIAGTHCPKRESAYFIPGVSPIDVSPVYRAIAIDNKTGLRACTPNPETTHMAVYEFWDAEYLDMFRRAGIKRNTPPPFMENCDLDTISAMRNNLVITSPADGTRVVIVSNDDYENISLRATGDMENTKIFWFIDDKMIGTSMPGETITHRTPMGEHTVRAMDEMGAASTINFSIVK